MTGSSIALLVEEQQEQIYIEKKRIRPGNNRNFKQGVPQTQLGNPDERCRYI